VRCDFSGKGYLIAIELIAGIRHEHRPTRYNFIPMKTETFKVDPDEIVFCSFCGKSSEADGDRFIAAKLATICEDCVATCNETLGKYFWTPVSKENPISWGEFHVTTQSPGGARFSGTGFFEAGDWELYGDLSEHKVVAWAPIPPPWQGGREMPLFGIES
jgi:hypothetical protein